MKKIIVKRMAIEHRKEIRVFVFRFLCDFVRDSTEIELSVFQRQQRKYLVFSMTCQSVEILEHV